MKINDSKGFTDTSSQNAEGTRTVKCPQCKNPSIYSVENLFRPFCSERCRLIDLGQWADEKYRVPLHHDESFQSLDSETEEQ